MNYYKRAKLIGTLYITMDAEELVEESNFSASLGFLNSLN